MLAFLVTAAAITALPIAGEPDPLTRVEDAYPSLSPDGSRLLFQSTRSGRWALYMAEPTGKNIKLFLDSGDDPVIAVWSPDGRRIAFAATIEGQSEIFMINADASGRRRLTSDPGDDSHPHWSVDGNRIFFNSAVQPSFTPDGTSLYASRVYEPLDFSWTYSHLVLVPVAELLGKN